MLTKSGIPRFARAVLCELTFHSWKGTCRCGHCAQTRDQDHDWAKGGFCSRCGIRIAVSMSDQHDHIWEGCKCAICECPDRSEPAKHRWHGCKCTVCGLVRDQLGTLLKQLPIVTEKTVADFMLQLGPVDASERGAIDGASKYGA